MPLTDQQNTAVRKFRAWLVETLANDPDLTPHVRDDREDESTLRDRWRVGKSVWIEVAIRPLLPQVRVGILTDDRWKSEEFEEKIEESGDTMAEFVGFGFEEADLDWEDPPVEHYRDGGKYFHFATPLELDSLDQLDRPEFRTKIVKMTRGYRQAFGAAL